MQLRIFCGPTRDASYDEIARAARHAEQCGFDGLFRPDHYRSLAPVHPPVATDAWLTLGGLARETSRIRLGTLVTAATFRLPGVLAIQVAQVDHMSSGRVELGIGTGWMESEHTAYGIPLPSLSERFDRLAEQLEIVTGLWRTPLGQTYTFRGKHYQLIDAPAVPPVQAAGPPIIVGGGGPKRTPELAARFGDEYNYAFRGIAETAAQLDRVREACERTGRAESGKAPLRYSAAIAVACGRNDGEVQARLGVAAPGQARTAGFVAAGSPAQVADQIGQFGQMGVTRAYLKLNDVGDLDHLDLLAAEVLPQLVA